MIIKLTRAEVHRFVSAALNINPSSFTVEISECAPNDARKAIDVLYALRTATSELPHPEQKISCIKRFRALCPKGADLYPAVGLADAKWAVENPAVAIHSLETTGQIR